MKFEQLKVRPKKLARKAPCAAEFASMLACWASSQDLRSQSECAEVTKLLRDCMTTAQQGPRKQAKPTINYHLARFSKHV
ncbi:hypothetical protein MARU1_001804 [Malassezia arunalokei]|uniref:37S ribosomal protein mrp10, mitochondrial n=1 Tax=Malassezia arunalokei TaxID=1514897 RepID=A0AAJ5YZ27_9BASI|nr:hypothetical protein MARU1_001804 [Malassezia arunalokei]